MDNKSWKDKAAPDKETWEGIAEPYMGLEFINSLTTDVDRACAKTSDKNRAADIRQGVKTLKIVSNRHQTDRVAIIAYWLALEIAEILGTDEARKPLLRHDTMRVEIENIVDNLEKDGKKITPTVVWQKLIEQTDQPSSCCAGQEHDEALGQNVILWFGIQGNMEKLTYSALKERLRRRKRAR
jgi:hypothetical protein